MSCGLHVILHKNIPVKDAWQRNDVSYVYIPPYTIHKMKEGAGDEA